MRERRQENEEREAVQGIIRKRQAEEGKKDRAHQRSCGGAEVYPLASPLQAHIEGSRNELQSGLIWLDSCSDTYLALCNFLVSSWFRMDIWIKTCKKC